MTIDQDIDALADGFAHGADAGFGIAQRRMPSSGMVDGTAIDLNAVNPSATAF